MAPDLSHPPVAVTVMDDLRLEDQHRRAALEQSVRLQARRARHTFRSALDSLALTLEERDACTASHSRRVRHYALCLADALGLDARQRRLLGLAARLHDIGKLAVPDAILHKPGPLTPAERAVMHLHPCTGERLLAPVVRNHAVLAAIRGHHERLDGSGYPDGLRGDCIPLLARLIAVPDCFDALTTARAYRHALPVAEALALLRAGAGRTFQPEFIRAFLDLVPLHPVGSAPLPCGGPAPE
jgi:HD-GYP domain-containing protein (c-di-GMP phosphodiesterase class II)